MPERYRVAYHRLLLDEDRIGYEYRVERFIRKEEFGEVWKSIEIFHDFMDAKNYLDNEIWPKPLCERDF